MKIIFFNFLLILFYCLNACTAPKNMLGYSLSEKNAISYVLTPKGDTIFKFKDPLSGDTVRYMTKKGRKWLLNEHGEFIIVETMPQFPNGERALFEFLNKNIHYPRIALEHGAQAIVTASFVVMADGHVDSAIIKDIKKLYDTRSPRKHKKLEKEIPEACYDAIKAEMLRVIEAMPIWTPATQQYKPVAVRFTLPVGFKLD